MADRFIEPGLYSPPTATFQGYIGNGSSTATSVLTVTSVSSGVITPGMILTSSTHSNQYLGNVSIISNGTGTGGTGTYNLQFSILVGTTGAPATFNGSGVCAPTKVPTWGIAQEGDGKAKGKATSATASITFQDGNAGSVNLFGVSFTLSGATGVAIADALANAINASTTAAPAGKIPQLTQIQELLYARGPTLRGDTTPRIDIMTRVGSADFNYVDTNSLGYIMTSMTTGTPVVSHFSGGASGAWGWLINTGTIWNSNRYTGTYSPLGSATNNNGTPGAVYQRPLYNEVLDGDTVYCRTTLNGSPILMLVPLHGSYPGFWKSYTTPTKLVFDDGTVWPEKNGRITIRFAQSFSNAGLLTRVPKTDSSGYQTGQLHVVGGDTTLDSDPNIVFESYYAGYNSSATGLLVAAQDRWERVLFSVGARDLPATAYGSGGDPLFYNSSSNVAPASILTQHNNSNYSGMGEFYNPVFESCIFVIKAYTGQIPVIGCRGNVGGIGYDALNCTIRGIGFNTAITGGVLGAAEYYGDPRLINIRNLKTEGIPAGSNLLTTNSYALNAVYMMEDTDLTNLEGMQGFFLENAQVGGNARVFVSSSTNKYSFLSEGKYSSVFWLPNKAMPKLNAMTPDGYQWAIGVQLTYSNPNFVKKYRPFYFPKMQIYNPNDPAVRTLTVNFLADVGKVILNDEHYITVQYIDDASGQTKSFTTRPKVASNVMNPVSKQTADWAPSQDDGSGNILPYSVLNSGVTRYYNRYQIVATTPTSVRKNTDISVTFATEKGFTTQGERYFLDPEILMS